MHEMNDAPPAPLDDFKLESRFALEQLTALAERLEPMTFVIMASSAFRREPSQALLSLQDALREGSIPNPTHTVTEDGGFLARYVEHSQSIEVERSAIEAALSEPQATCPLLIALCQAFARYIDEVVLHPSSGVPASVPETPELADSYHLSLALFDEQVRQGADFGHYSSPEVSGQLTLDLSNPEDYFAANPPNELLPNPARFSAGKGDGSADSFAHESIESVLGDLGFSELDRKAIYFGNWLRDYSQLLDPKIVRPVDAPKQFPSKLSRAALTEVIDLLAVKEFNALQETPEGRDAFRVVADKVGVYRPSEHIDNPLQTGDVDDPRLIDPDFEAPIPADDPRWTVDTERSMYPYIDDATRYMREKLLQALEAGQTPDGMRCFGEALHVLEDFFAHSNFVELSLRKAGHTSVLPWTTEKDCKHRWPVVTGLFSGTDVLASVAEPLAKFMFPDIQFVYKATHPGDRSDTEKMLLILLEEHEDPKWKSSLQSFLNARDKLAESPVYQTLEAGSFLITLPYQALTYLVNLVMNAILTWAGDSVDDVQTLLGADPNSDGNLFPTHSQLAKDHDTHPFHGLAALLAQQAVAEVGRSMKGYWDGDHGRDPITLAESFIRHANDSDWQDEIVEAWAKDHADQIRTGSSLTALHEVYERDLQTSRERLKTLGENDGYELNTYQQSLNNLFLG